MSAPMTVPVSFHATGAGDLLSTTTIPVDTALEQATYLLDSVLDTIHRHNEHADRGDELFGVLHIVGMTRAIVESARTGLLVEWAGQFNREDAQ